MWARIIGGLVLATFGIIFALQGAGVVGDEADGGMNGNELWIVLGPIISLIGAYLVYRGLQMRKAAKESVGALR